jgi:hypothetical protein
MPDDFVLGLLVEISGYPATDRERIVEESAKALERTQDPLVLTAQILMMSLAIPDRLLDSFHRASMRITRPSLRTLAVHALDTQWETLPDWRAAMKELFVPLSLQDEQDLIHQILEMAGVKFERSGQRAPPGPAREQPPTRVVNTGFVDSAAPMVSVVGTTLGCKRLYYFWLDVGALRDDSIERISTPLPDLPAGADLRVVLFGVQGHLEIDRGHRSGDLRMKPDGSCRVIRPAALPPDTTDEARARQLYFPVRVPTAPGYYSLRCSIYCKQNLLQSRLVTARATAAPESDSGALVSELDYAVTHLMDPTHFTAMAEQQVSLFLNNNGATHCLRVVGEGDFVGDCELSEAVIEDAVDLAHCALHTAAWGEKVTWEQSRRQYRYGGASNRAYLVGDLVDLARIGDKLATALVYAFAKNDDVLYDRLTAILRKPGSLQLGLRKSPNHVLPVALIYDKPIDSQRDDLRLCPRFLADLDGAASIADGACLRGSCPTWDDQQVVCPSGFWGYRHKLGVPLSLQPGSDAPVDISYAANIDIGMCVSTDFDYQDHEKTLKASKAGIGITVAADRNTALTLISQPQQIVYFYCHGGYTTDGFPTLFVGGKNELAIAAENLKSVRWNSPQPLVLLNGCHTTTFAQRKMLDFVQAFVVRSHAAGLIGTEITVFESLARKFAEECLALFLDGQAIGEAVRRARLSVLQKQYNPLGLVYIPYVSTGVQLVAQT